MRLVEGRKPLIPGRGDPASLDLHPQESPIPPKLRRGQKFHAAK